MNPALLSCSATIYARIFFGILAHLLRKLLLMLCINWWINFGKLLEHWLHSKNTVLYFVVWKSYGLIDVYKKRCSFLNIMNGFLIILKTANVCICVHRVQDLTQDYRNRTMKDELIHRTLVLFHWVAFKYFFCGGVESIFKAKLFFIRVRFVLP